jgi:ribosomal protein L37AE/L43A
MKDCPSCGLPTIKSLVDIYYCESCDWVGTKGEFEMQKTIELLERNQDDK